MIRKTKHLRKMWVAVSLLWMTVMASMCVQAKPSVSGATYVTLKPGKVYKNYDLDGDGKKDTFRYDYTGQDAIWGITLSYDKAPKYVTLTLNGKTSRIYPHDKNFGKSAEKFISCTISLYQYSQKNTFLLTETEITSDPSESETIMFRYQNGKPQKVLSPINIGRNYLERIKGKDLYFATSRSGWGGGLDELLYVNRYRFHYRLDASKHRLTLASPYGDITRCEILAYSGRTFRTSSSEKTMNKKGMALKKGRHYIVTKIYINPRNGHYVYRLKRRNETGWIDENQVMKQMAVRGVYPFAVYYNY